MAVIIPVYRFLMFENCRKRIIARFELSLTIFLNQIIASERHKQEVNRKNECTDSHRL